VSVWCGRGHLQRAAKYADVLSRHQAGRVGIVLSMCDVILRDTMGTFPTSPVSQLLSFITLLGLSESHTCSYGLICAFHVHLYRCKKAVVQQLESWTSTMISKPAILQYTNQDNEQTGNCLYITIKILQFGRSSQFTCLWPTVHTLFYNIKLKLQR